MQDNSRQSQYMAQTILDIDVKKVFLQHKFVN